MIYYKMIFSCNLGILTRHYKNPMIMHYACPSIPVMWDCLCINPVSDPKGVGIFKGLEKDFACMYTNYVLWNVLKYCLETLVGIGCRAVSFFFLYYCLRLCKERWFTRTIKKKSFVVFQYTVRFICLLDTDIFQKIDYFSTCSSLEDLSCVFLFAP